MFLATLTLILIVSGSSRRIGHHRQQQQHRQHKHHRQHASLRTNGENDDHAMDVLLDALERGKEDEAKNSKDIERKFSHSCWGYCDQGHCDWSHKGCKCVCKTNFEGRCCTKMIDCGPGTEKCCPRENLKPHKAKCSQLYEDVRDGRSTLVLGTEEMGLTPDKQGIFWLTKQGAKSSLMSFARTNDGCGIADARAEKNEMQSFTKENPFRIRVAGDRTWSDGGGYESSTFKAAAAIDLVYNFIEEEKGKIVIVPQITRGFFDIHVARWLMEFRADLLDPSDIMNHKSPYTTSPDGSQNSVVWRRTSNAFFNLKQIGGAGEYDLVQVLDGQGNKLEPAYSDFVKGCSNWREMNERREDGTFEMFWLEDNEHPETQGGTQRIVYGRDIESAANDEYYFRIAE